MSVLFAVRVCEDETCPFEGLRVGCSKINGPLELWASDTHLWGVSGVVSTPWVVARPPLLPSEDMSNSYYDSDFR